MSAMETPGTSPAAISRGTSASSRAMRALSAGDAGAPGPVRARAPGGGQGHDECEGREP
ncbi:hypothetical protein [Longimicrobium terrae]|uniref:hypothetical protein n=1 Tax=Longimicrobium terrae TaxID=1639882 RepID=UPI001475CD6E|nr:hypothetical protein [Longimicrobium terrae]NNC33239.1 hypothetical protein [Longimicrobium terrae]